MMDVKRPVTRIRMGGAGPDVSRIVYGAWRLGDNPSQATPANAAETIRACLDIGITTFDHADIYGGYTCEELFGAAVAELGARRDDMELVSKCGIMLVSPNRPGNRSKHYDTGKSHIMASAERSLRNLRTDRLDCLLIHRPDPLMDADEIADAFTALRQQGKVLHFGVSNFLPHQYELLASRLGFPLVGNQIELSVLCLAPLTDGTMDQCQRLRTTPMAWSPLAGGRLYRDQGEREQRVRAALASIGAEHGGASIDQVALAWILRHPACPVPIVGTGSIERIRSAAAADAIELTREQWHTIWSASMGAAVP